MTRSERAGLRLGETMIPYRTVMAPAGEPAPARSPWHRRRPGWWRWITWRVVSIRACQKLAARQRMGGSWERVPVMAHWTCAVAGAAWLPMLKTGPRVDALERETWP